MPNSNITRIWASVMSVIPFSEKHFVALLCVAPIALACAISSSIPEMPILSFTCACSSEVSVCGSFNNISSLANTLGGFAVPMEAYIERAVTGKGLYKCYRTSNPLSAGTRSFVIS